MVDEIRRLTDLIARDPANLAFRDLAERLRVRGDLDAAHRVALRGLERHTLDAESHALLARICVDRGELQRAFDEWDMALRLSPRHLGALKGLGFISYRWGKLADAERYLLQALQLSPGDASITGAVDSVRAAQASLARFPSAKAPAASDTADARQNGSRPDAREPESAVQPVWSPPPAAKPQPRDVFAGLAAEAQVQTLLVDASGLVLAGRFIASGGVDRGAEIGAELSGVSEEADRAIRHLKLGDWRSITFESESAVVALARGHSDSLVVVASDHTTPLGLLRRSLERAQTAARSWLEEDG